MNNTINLKSGRKVKKHYDWAKGIIIGNEKKIRVFHPYTIKEEFKKEFEDKYKT